MAYFKHSTFFTQDNSPEFDKLHNPGITTPFSGLYRCHQCGTEADSTKGHPLPPEHHARNAPHQRTRWQLIAAAHPV
jgi:hypothetical protein